MEETTIDFDRWKDRIECIDQCNFEIAREPFRAKDNIEMMTE